MSWLRMDAGTYDSAWLEALPWDVRGLWGQLLCLVKQSGTRGVLPGWSARKIAGMLGCPESALLCLLDAGVADGAVSMDGGRVCVVNWERYQEPDRTAAARMSAYRRRRKVAPVDGLDESYGVTPVTGDEISECNGVTPSCVTTRQTNQHTSQEGVGGRESEGGGIADPSGAGSDPPPGKSPPANWDGMGVPGEVAALLWQVGRWQGGLGRKPAATCERIAAVLRRIEERAARQARGDLVRVGLDVGAGAWLLRQAEDVVSYWRARRQHVDGVAVLRNWVDVKLRDLPAVAPAFAPRTLEVVPDAAPSAALRAYVGADGRRVMLRPSDAAGLTAWADRHALREAPRSLGAT